MDRIVSVFSRIGTESTTYGKILVRLCPYTDQRKPIFQYVSPSAYRNNFSYVYFNLKVKGVFNICVLDFDLVYFSSIYRI